MKIVSQDTNVLTATDKAPGLRAAEIAAGAAGVVIFGIGLVTGLIELVILGALALIFFTAKVLLRNERTLLIDKNTGQIHLDEKSILRKRHFQYLLGLVVKVELTTRLETIAAPITSRFSASVNIGKLANVQIAHKTQVHLVLAEGTTVDIADGQSRSQLFGAFGQSPNLEVAEQIAGFLGVPFEQPEPSAAASGSGRRS